MSCQPRVKGDASTNQGNAPGGRTAQHTQRGETWQGLKEYLDGNVPSYHNVLDERMGRDGSREDLQDWKRAVGRNDM